MCHYLSLFCFVHVGSVFLVVFRCEEVFLLGYDCGCSDGHDSDGSDGIGGCQSGSGLFDDGGLGGYVGGCEYCAGVSVEDGGHFSG